MDRSLKSASSLVRHRNVLTRPERLAKLQEEEKWDESKSVFGLPKVGHRKLELAKAEKTDAVAGEPGAAGAAAAPAAGAKGAAPAAGAAKAGAPPPRARPPQVAKPPPPPPRPPRRCEEEVERLLLVTCYWLLVT